MNAILFVALHCCRWPDSDDNRVATDPFGRVYSHRCCGIVAPGWQSPGLCNFFSFFSVPEATIVDSTIVYVFSAEKNSLFVDLDGRNWICFGRRRNSIGLHRRIAVWDPGDSGSCCYEPGSSYCFHLHCLPADSGDQVYNLIVDTK